MNSQFLLDILKLKCGSLRYRQIVNTIRNLKQLEIKSSGDFKRLKSRINDIGTLDYNMVKATIYRENFEYALQHAQEYEGFDILQKYLNRIKNPERFYKYIKQSNVMSDIFAYYKPRR